MAYVIKAVAASMVVFAMGILPAEAALRVGAARVDQTGKMGEAQSGEYEHEHVYARAIVLESDGERAALISYEGPNDGFDMLTTRKAIAEELGAGLNNIIVTHTHTHSSSAYPDEEIEEVAVSASLFAAAKQAATNLQPALVSYGEGISYLNVNRDAINPETRKWMQGINLDGEVDRSVGVLTFVNPDGAPIAAWVNYAMHPINGYVLGFVSGDVPGAMSRYIEQAFDDSMVAAFSQGTSGNVNALYLRLSNNAMASRLGEPTTGYLMDRETFEGPLRAAETFGGEEAPPVDQKALDRLFRFIESQGAVLGEEVIRVMSNAKDWDDDVRIAGSSQSFSCPGRRRTNGNAWDPATREGVPGEYVDADPQQLNVGLLGIGNMSIVTMNGEIYSPIGKRVKEEAPMNNTMIVTIANERVRGYIPDDASFGQQTFQVLNNFIKPGCAEPGIVKSAVELQNQYLGNN